MFLADEEGRASMRAAKDQRWARWFWLCLFYTFFFFLSFLTFIIDREGRVNLPTSFFSLFSHLSDTFVYTLKQLEIG